MTYADLVEAGDGVWAAIVKPDSGAVGNAAVVQVGDETLVVDTHLSPAAARELQAAAEEHTGRGASWVLNTHWHPDHVFGNGEFPGATIVSTGRTRELIATSAGERLEERKREGGEGTAELPSELRLPDETFDERRDLGAAQALTLGGGHTESDAVLLVPDARVLVAGDLIVTGPMQPWAGHGDAAEWALILEGLLKLEWDTVVPGHGPVSGREVVEPLRDYVLALDEAIRSDETEPGLPARFRDWGQPEMWARNVAALRER